MGRGLSLRVGGRVIEKSEPPDSFFTGVPEGFAGGSLLSFCWVSPLASLVVGLTVLGWPQPWPCRSGGVVFFRNNLAA